MTVKVLCVWALTMFMFTIGYLIGRFEPKKKSKHKNNDWIEEMIERRWNDGDELF